MTITMRPIAMPSGITRTARSSATQIDATTAPRAMPSAVTPWRIAALERSKLSVVRAHSMTMNCSVAPAPQKRVVTASEIWPRRSFHRCTTQREKSFSVSSGCAGSALQRHAGARHLEIEERRDSVHRDDDRDRRLGGGVDRRVDVRQVEVQHAPRTRRTWMSRPPSTVPSRIEATVRPSIQPLARTSLRCGRYSVRMPYLAGE